MSKLHRGAALILVSISLCTTAQALPNRIWVSGHGSDAGGCGSVSSPCRTFLNAHNSVEPGGEIYVMDSADYGPLVIDRAISIINDGAGTATVEQPQSDAIAITINAPKAAQILLRGLTIEGHDRAYAGVLVNSGASLVVQNCSFRGFVGQDMRIIPTTPLSFLISDSSFTGSGSGIYTSPRNQHAAPIAGVVKNSRFSGLVSGMGAYGTPLASMTLTIEDSIITGNSAGGARFGVNADIHLTRVTSSHNAGNGFEVIAGGTLTLQSSIANNNGGWGVRSDNGQVNTYKDNSFMHNKLGNVSASLTAVGRF